MDRPTKLYNHIQQMAEKPCSKYAHTKDIFLSQTFFLSLPPPEILLLQLNLVLDWRGKEIVLTSCRAE